MLLQSGLTAHAIVIRHDTGYARHTARESLFPAVFFLEQRAHRKVCVATLIHPQWALTAAHCLDETPVHAALRSGSTYTVRIAGQPQLIDAAVVHPDYQRSLAVSLNAVDGSHAGTPSAEVDLALLRLQQPVRGLRPVGLYRDQSELGQIVTLLGWGYFGIGTRGIQVDDGQFRLARNTIHTADHRLRFTFNDPRSLESPAIDLEGVPGQGDSGGPALLAQESGGWLLAGVAIGEQAITDDLAPGAPESRRPQGMYGAVAVYERVSLHIDWIESVLFAAGSGSERDSEPGGGD
jgi:hypothetical protein